MAVTHEVGTRSGGLKEIELTRSLAIKAFCTECMGWDHPKHCTSINCPLYPFRGKTNITIR